MSHGLLQATILVAGLMVFKDHALLGLGLMLSAGEIPRIAGAFGLDTTTRANISSAVYTAQSAVSMARTVVPRRDEDLYGVPRASPAKRVAWGEEAQRNK